MLLKTINRDVNFLLISLFISFLFLIYTGRYHPGLWTITGIIFTIVLSEIIINAVNSKFDSFNKKDIILSGLIFLLSFLSCISNPHGNMLKDYTNRYFETLAVYELIGPKSDKIALLRLPDARDLPHPSSLWIGNKIYHGEYGLSYFQEYNILRMKDMYIENYNNFDNKDFSFFADLISNKSDKLIYIFKNKNIFFKFYKENNDNKIFSAVSWNNSDTDYYDINFLPGLKFNNYNSHMRVDLLLYKTIDSDDVVFFNNNVINNYSVDGLNISFIVPIDFNTSKVSIMNHLTGKSFPIQKIDIFLNEKFYYEFNTNNYSRINPPVIRSRSKPCNIDIRSKYVDIYATVSPNTDIIIDTLYPISELNNDYNITYSTFEINDRFKTRKINSSISLNNLLNNYCDD
jgi:hypothetical protein